MKIINLLLCLACTFFSGVQAANYDIAISFKEATAEVACSEDELTRMHAAIASALGDVGMGYRAQSSGWLTLTGQDTTPRMIGNSGILFDQIAAAEQLATHAAQGAAQAAEDRGGRHLCSGDDCVAWCQLGVQSGGCDCCPSACYHACSGSRRMLRNVKAEDLPTIRGDLAAAASRHAQGITCLDTSSPHVHFDVADE